MSQPAVAVQQRRLPRCGPWRSASASAQPPGGSWRGPARRLVELPSHAYQAPRDHRVQTMPPCACRARGHVQPAWRCRRMRHGLGAVPLCPHCGAHRRVHPDALFPRPCPPGPYGCLKTASPHSKGRWRRSPCRAALQRPNRPARHPNARARKTGRRLQLLPPVRPPDVVRPMHRIRTPTAHTGHAHVQRLPAPAMVLCAPTVRQQQERAPVRAPSLVCGL